MDSRDGERSEVGTKRTRKFRRLRVPVRYRTIVVPGLGDHCEAILVDWTDRASAWKWTVHVHGVRCTALILGVRKMRVKLHCRLGTCLGAREEEWALVGVGSEGSLMLKYLLVKVCGIISEGLPTFWTRWGERSPLANLVRVVLGSLMFSTWLNGSVGIGEGWPCWTTNGDKLSQLAGWVDRAEEGFKPRGAGWQTLYLQ